MAGASPQEGSPCRWREEGREKLPSVSNVEGFFFFSFSNWATFKETNRPLVSIFSSVCVAFVLEHPAGRTALVALQPPARLGSPQCLQIGCSSPSGWARGWQHPGVEQPCARRLCFTELPLLCAKALPVVWKQLFAASESASKLCFLHGSL